MRYQYGEYDGQPFPTPDSLFPSPKLVQFILQYGEQAMEAMENVDEQYARMIEEMIQAGLLERDEQTGQLRMTPRMIKGIQHRALLEVFRDLHKGTRDGHETVQAGRSDERTEGLRPYAFGDKLSELDVAATLRNTLKRVAADGLASTQPPLRIQPSDFELFVTEGQADCAVCILLDLSGSMMRYGRYYQAKRVVLGLQSLVSQKFPLDTVDVVGFSSLAETISERELPLILPKPVSIFDPQVRMRIPLQQAEAEPEQIPQHFTNLQLGLRTARRMLSRRGAANKLIFIITDGQPTAHVAANPAGGEMLYLQYPPTQETAEITLHEAFRCQQQGMRIASFALVEDYFGMGWVGFIDRLTRLVRGVSYYCSGEDLSSTVLESYLSGRRSRKYIA